MSLDVSLFQFEYLTCECGRKHKIKTEEIYSRRITHNMREMAKEANVYSACWEPEKINAVNARDIIPTLKKGIKNMKARPDHYKQSNPLNGWGSYNLFLSWLEEYLIACEKFPDAIIEVDR